MMSVGGGGDKFRPDPPDSGTSPIGNDFDRELFERVFWGKPDVMVPPMPDKAPELWGDRGNQKELIAEFITRIYGKYISKDKDGNPTARGMTQKDLRRLDMVAYLRLQQWCTYRGIKASSILPALRSDPAEVLARPDVSIVERRHAQAAMRNRRYREKKKRQQEQEGTDRKKEED